MVVFDLDDTLYPYEPCHRTGMAALTRFAAAQLKVQERAFLEVWARAREAVKARLGPTGSSHSRLLYAHEAIELLGLRSQPGLALAMEQEYWREYLLAARLRSGAADLLGALRYHGVVVGMVTDLTAQIQFRKLVHLGLDKLFDHVVTSEEATTDKIGLEPFRVLLERVGDDARRHVWFVGDSVADVDCVDRLVEEGLIGSGCGWLLDSKAPRDDAHLHWRDLGDVERELNRLVDRRSA
jgi:putative hydrolase of the HAD superfamily